MYLPTIFNIALLITLAITVVDVSAQDPGPGFITKCVKPGHVALTFDDGPSPSTPKLLDYLKTANIHATFFVLGKSINAQGGNATLRAVFEAGHQIALHSNTHPDLNSIPPQTIKEEYEICLKAVVGSIGKHPIMARPPFGNCNEACAKVLQGEMKLTVIQWNCDSNDWRYTDNAADRPKTFTNIENIINPSNPKTDSFITLQHDTKDYSVEYVPKIINVIKAKGYRFVTVERCLGGNITAYSEGSVSAAGKLSPAISLILFCLTFGLLH